MRSFQYASPTTIEDALRLIGEGPASNGDGEVRPFAGGTDLLTLMKADIAAPAQLVDVKRLDGLAAGIDERDGGVTLGALTTLAEIEQSPLLRERYPLLSEAASLAATPQLRNMATVGGTLLQRPRCWYYRNRLFHCWLKGGDECQAREGENQYHALFGESPCVAVHPSDLASGFLALEAAVRLRGPEGERTLPVAEFFALPEEGRRIEHTVRAGELVVSIELPALPAGTRSVYLKAMDRKAWAFALVGVAAVLRQKAGKIEHARLVLTGVAPIPWRVPTAEQLLVGQAPSPALFEQAAEAALAGARALEHNGYKIPLAKGLIRQALTALTSLT